jgi:hypothetical protein
MTRAIQKQIERSRQAASGSKRVEVVLDAESLVALERIKAHYGYKTNSHTIEHAIFALDVLVG